MRSTDQNSDLLRQDFTSAWISPLPTTYTPFPVSPSASVVSCLERNGFQRLEGPTQRWWLADHADARKRIERITITQNKRENQKRNNHG